MSDIISQIALNWEFTVLDVITEGLIIAGLWQLFSHIDGKRQEEHLEERLDNLYKELRKFHEEEKEVNRNEQ